MSKKTKGLTILFSVLLIIVITLSLLTIFVFTKPRITKPKLEKPSIDILNDGTKKILVSDNNLSANGYGFYIYDGDEPENTCDYIMNKTNKGKYYFDVTDLFVEAKKYYFYCQCLGDDKFEDSEFSEIKSFQNKFNLITPELAINGMELSWTNVPNASKYKIYLNGTAYAETTERKYDINQAVNSSNALVNKFYICAIGNEYYYDSAKSNVITHDKTIYSLSNILNFNINNTTLSWSGVANADRYEILMNGIHTYTTTSTSYNFASLLLENGVYSFKIRAVRGNDLYSNYTDTLLYTKTQKLNKVTFLPLVDDVDKIIVSWSAVENAINYQVVIKVNGEIISTENLLVTSKSIDKPVGGSSMVIEITTLGYDYYTDSEVSVKTI